MITNSNIFSLTRRVKWLFIEIIFILIFIGLSCNLTNIKSMLISLLVLATTFFCLISVNAIYLNKIKRPRLLNEDVLKLLKGFVFLFLVLLFYYFIGLNNFDSILELIFFTSFLFFLLSATRGLEFLLFSRKKKSNLAIFINPNKRWINSLLEIKKVLGDDWKIKVIQSTPNFVHENIEIWSTAEFNNYLEKGNLHKQDHIIIFDEIQPKEQLSNKIIQEVYGKSFIITSINKFYEEVLEKAPILETNNNWYFSSITHKQKFPYSTIKRIIDIVSASLLLFFFIPIILILIVMIKRESKGPAFFNQKRLGLNGKAFTCYKLRTMEEHEDDVNQWPHFSSHHVTKLGEKLRKTGLDELPQLLNVILGDMSMVGPRPLRQKLAESHLEKNPFFAITLSFKPGISGWAQVHQGKDTGYDTLVEKIRYDLYYANNFSLGLDLQIYIMTFSQLITGKKPKVTVSSSPHQINLK